MKQRGLYPLNSQLSAVVCALLESSEKQGAAQASTKNHSAQPSPAPQPLPSTRWTSLRPSERPNLRRP
ncbi:MAG: hypothetical protein ACQKBY_10680 [Verrucomicrobiales bacterium]